MIDAIETLYRDLFETDRRGAAILADLKARFCRPPPTRYDDAAMNEVFARAHQRAVVDFIQTQIDRANGAQDQGEIDL